MMKPPLEPNREDCCNSGCNPCIFDIYEKQLALYTKYLETGELDELPEKNAISQIEYTIFIVTENIQLCRSHKLLKFRCKSDIDSRVYWKPGDHFLLKFSTENGSCTRAYTPIKLKHQSKEDFDFLIVVKKYDNGLVSNYLYNLQAGAEILWRGPYGAYEITPNKFKRIFITVQGTGIAPVISIIEEILNNEEDFTKLLLYYCCQSLDCVLFRECLYTMKSYWNFTYEVFLKEPSDNTCFKYMEPVRNQKLNCNNFNVVKPFHSDDQFLLCGSPNFMKAYQDWLVNVENFKGSVVLF